MAIQGDIDLTEKLDFRVDKKEKLLPSTELKSRALKSMESVAERNKLPDLDLLDISHTNDITYYPAISNEDGSVITYSFPNYRATATNTFTFRTTNNWSWSTYPTEFDTVSWYPEYIDPSYGVTISYTSSNTNNITTWNFKYDIRLEDSIASCEENFSLNDKREKDYSLNKSCYDNDFVLGDRRTKPLTDLTKNAFNSELIEDARGYYYDPDYQYQGMLWDSKEDEEYDPYSWNKDAFDAIPWFDRMRNSRIRSDYIDSLNDVEQNFDSYLTDYSWLRLH